MRWKQIFTGVAVAASMSMVSGSAVAQSTATGSQSGSSQSGTSATAGSQGQDTAGTHASRMSATDQDKFFKKAAMANFAEVQLAQLGVEKAQNPQVKQFAQQMVESHQRALDELKQAAGSTADLPATLDEKHQKKHDKLAKLNGEEFDREFMDTMVDAHKSMEDLLADNVEGRPSPAMEPGAGGATGTTGGTGTTTGQPGTGTEPTGSGAGTGSTSGGAGTGAGTSGTARGVGAGASASPRLSGPAYQWASKALQEVRSHLEQAKELKDQIKK